MGAMMARANFPIRIWSGLSDNPFRKRLDDQENPDYRDWDQVVAEVTATQTYAVSLGNHVSDVGYTFTSGTMILSGEGEPAIAAPIGSLYLRTDGGTDTTLYVKESGIDETGWVAK